MFYFLSALLPRIHVLLAFSNSYLPVTQTFLIYIHLEFILLFLFTALTSLCHFLFYSSVPLFDMCSVFHPCRLRSILISVT